MMVKHMTFKRLEEEGGGMAQPQLMWDFSKFRPLLGAFTEPDRLMGQLDGYYLRSGREDWRVKLHIIFGTYIERTNKTCVGIAKPTYSMAYDHE
jgi:hypothetical protein